MKTTFRLKAVLFLVIGCMVSSIANAQMAMATPAAKADTMKKEPKKPKKPLSPRVSVSDMVGSANITINYGSPSVRHRKIWGGLVPLDTVWRTGANAATTFTTDKDIMVEGKKLPAGKYGFFAIPGTTSWIIIFNSVPDQWGAFKYDASKDILRVTVTPKEAGKHNHLVYKINSNGFSLIWAKLEIPVMIQ